jgi:hypothetical protein
MKGKEGREKKEGKGRKGKDGRERKEGKGRKGKEGRKGRKGKEGRKGRKGKEGKERKARNSFKIMKDEMNEFQKIYGFFCCVEQELRFLPPLKFASLST